MKKIPLYYLAKFFFELILVYPFYTLIFQIRGQDEAGIGWLLAIWSLSVIVFEIPMGVLSDRMKRRNVLIIAVLVKALAFVLWIPDFGFVWLAVGFVLWGLSIALLSGTEEAWLYETLYREGQHKLYSKIKGRGNFFSAIAIALAAPIGGWFSQWGMEFVVWMSVGVSVFAGIFILGFGNPPRTSLPEEEQSTSWFKDIRIAFKEILTRRNILILVIFSGTLLITSGVLDEWDPLFLTDLGLTPFLLGCWMTIRFLCESVGAALAHKVENIFKNPKLMIIAAGVMALPLIGLGFFGSFFWLIAYAVFYFVYSLLNVLAETRIQDSMHGGHRATVLSFKSLFENAVGIIMILAAGYAGKQFGLSIIWIASGCYAATVAMVLFILSNKKAK